MSDVHFVGARVRLARELRHLTLSALAEKAALSPGYLSKIERGTSKPESEVREAIAEALELDPRFFALPEPAQVADGDCTFRSLVSTPLAQRARARARATLLTEFVRCLDDLIEGIPEYAVPNVPCSSLEGAEEVANRVRMELGLGLDGPIADMIGVLEHCGVVVTRLDDTTDQIDAFSWKKERGLVALSADKQSATRSRFDAAHELGHLVMHQPASELTHDRALEDQANAFASAFLMPRPAFTRDFPRGLNWPLLFDMKEHWGVSVAAIVYRARRLELLGAADYLRAQKFMSAKGWRRGEPREPAMEEPGTIKEAMELVDLDEIMGQLSWTPQMLEEVTGLAVPRPSPPQPDTSNVVDLASRRRPS